MKTFAKKLPSMQDSINIGVTSLRNIFAKTNVSKISRIEPTLGSQPSSTKIYSFVSNLILNNHPSNTICIANYGLDIKQLDCL